MRFFNTTGPVRADIHYCLPPLRRWDLAAILSLIHQQKYFVLHAPRQTGKTTCLLALMKALNEDGQYRALYANVETGQSAREDVARAMRTILADIGERARDYLGDPFVLEAMGAALQDSGGDGALRSVLTGWAAASPKPLVLMLDEVDSLVGDTLISLLRQLRGGYDKRPLKFPQTVLLCGVRDVRDYRIHSSEEKSVITGGSAFNIKAESLRLGDFSPQDIAALYSQHTEETGQRFDPEALSAVWDLSKGQPWLVNALAYEACFRMKENHDRSRTITAAVIEASSENLILRRETHLDQLTDKLKELRVKRILEPLIAGESLGENVSEDDLQYTVDLGLVRRDSSGIRVANGIYREVIPRQLTEVTQVALESEIPSGTYIRADGQLDMDRLLHGFQQFFRENSEHWSRRFDYQEAWPQLLLQAYLQRVVNGGGQVHREYGLGSGRTDLLIAWRTQKIVLELKILRSNPEKVIQQGLEQTSTYMDRCGSAEGHLILFDRRPAASWEEKIWRREIHHRSRRIVVWGM